MLPYFLSRVYLAFLLSYQNIFLRVSVDLQMYIVNTSFVENAKQSKIIHLILSILRNKELGNNCSKVDFFSDIH